MPRTSSVGFLYPWKKWPSFLRLEYFRLCFTRVNKSSIFPIHPQISPGLPLGSHLFNSPSGDCTQERTQNTVPTNGIQAPKTRSLPFQEPLSPCCGTKLSLPSWSWHLFATIKMTFERMHRAGPLVRVSEVTHFHSVGSADKKMRSVIAVPCFLLARPS